jgi:hypothetical protein
MHAKDLEHAEVVKAREAKAAAVAVEKALEAKNVEHAAAIKEQEAKVQEALKLKDPEQAAAVAEAIKAKDAEHASTIQQMQKESQANYLNELGKQRESATAEAEAAVKAKETECAEAWTRMIAAKDGELASTAKAHAAELKQKVDEHEETLERIEEERSEREQGLLWAHTQEHLEQDKATEIEHAAAMESAKATLEAQVADLEAKVVEKQQILDAQATAAAEAAESTTAEQMQVLQAEVVALKEEHAVQEAKFVEYDEIVATMEGPYNMECLREFYEAYNPKQADTDTVQVVLEHYPLDLIVGGAQLRYEDAPQLRQNGRVVEGKVTDEMHAEQERRLEIEQELEKDEEEGAVEAMNEDEWQEEYARRLKEAESRAEASHNRLNHLTSPGANVHDSVEMKTPPISPEHATQPASSSQVQPLSEGAQVDESTKVKLQGIFNRLDRNHNGTIANR